MKTGQLNSVMQLKEAATNKNVPYLVGEKDSPWSACPIRTTTFPYVKSAGLRDQFCKMCNIISDLIRCEETCFAYVIGYVSKGRRSLRSALRKCVFVHMWPDLSVMRHNLTKGFAVPGHINNVSIFLFARREGPDRTLGMWPRSPHIHRRHIFERECRYIFRTVETELWENNNRFVKNPLPKLESEAYCGIHTGKLWNCVDVYLVVQRLASYSRTYGNWVLGRLSAIFVNKGDKCL